MMRFLRIILDNYSAADSEVVRSCLLACLSVLRNYDLACASLGAVRILLVPTPQIKIREGLYVGSPAHIVLEDRKIVIEAYLLKQVSGTGLASDGAALVTAHESMHLVQYESGRMPLWEVLTNRFSFFHRRSTIER